MANFKIGNVKISGIAACVPKNTVENINHPTISKEDVEKLISSTGIEKRRIADDGVCTSDLSIKAAEELLEKLGWGKNEVEILIFVSQTPDYILPITSALLQHKLQLPKSCIAFDIPLGCSGYVYGLSTLASMMQASKLKKALLVVGDTSSKFISQTDKSTEPIFGDASTVTALEYDETAPEMFFSLGTDGEGFETIIIPSGGYRNPYNSESLQYRDIENGISRNNCQMALDGMNVFTFGLSQVPQNVSEVLAYAGKSIDDIEYFVFHQANLFMNEKIRKKLKIGSEKVPYSLKDYGNTSSATIPLTIVTELKNKLNNGNQVLLCGFGVGLSWGSAIVTAKDIVVLEVIEH